MYQYHVKARLADTTLKEINLQDYSEELRAAIDSFNRESKRSRFNPKSIDKSSMKIEPEYWSFILESQVPLERPGLSIRRMSTSLLKTEFGHKCAERGALFKTTSSEVVKKTSSEIQLVKALVDLLSSNFDDKENASTYNQISALLTEWAQSHQK